MTKQKGFTLVEIMIAIILSAMALFGIETLIVTSFKDFNTGKEIVDLQRDLDTASYQIKGVLEEANDYIIYDVPRGTARGLGQQGTDIVASNTNWSASKEFYLNSGKIYNTYPPTVSGIIIDTCSSLGFTNADTQIKVDLTVVKNIQSQTRQLSNSFLIYLRNKGGG